MTLKSITMNLSNNKIQDLGIRFLCKSFIELPLLKKIKLIFDSTNCSAVGCRYIGRLIDHHQKLKSIYISLRHNKILQQGGQLINSGIKKLKQISNIVLIFQGCQVGNKFLLQFTSLLPKLPLQLLFLNLIQCNINDNEAVSLARCFINMTLKEAYVDLRKNPITNQCKKIIDCEIEMGNINYKLDIKLP